MKVILSNMLVAAAAAAVSDVIQRILVACWRRKNSDDDGEEIKRNMTTIRFNLIYLFNRVSFQKRKCIRSLEISAFA